MLSGTLAISKPGKALAFISPSSYSLSSLSGAGKLLGSELGSIGRHQIKQPNVALQSERSLISPEEASVNSS